MTCSGDCSTCSRKNCPGPGENNDRKRSQRNWSLVLFLPLAVGLLWVLLGVCGALWGASIFDDDFNAYNLGDLGGQGDWTNDYESIAVVVDSPTAEGARAVKTGDDPSEGLVAVRKTGTPTGIGITYFYAYFLANSDGYLLLQEIEGGQARLYIRFVSDGAETTISVKDGCDTHSDIAVVDLNEWVLFGIDWNTTTGNSRFLVDDTWFSYFDCVDLDTDFENIIFYNDSGDVGNWYLDFISSEADLPPEEEVVWAISPASETEITDLTATFDFGWEGLADWDTLLVAFENRPTGIFSEATIYEIETIGESGTKELTFADFNFDRNGKFYFYALASKLEMEILEDMYLTGGYSYDWTDDLVDPEHWFIVNIEGFVSIFEMSDFETWYSENADKFVTSTAMFVAITGFFEPTFNKIGEFGNRIKDYFNLDEAYSQGYDIGKTIPYFTFFVAQVSLFLGGFPILKWVFVVVLLLVGIFIFRLVLKFIPGLGG